MSSNDQLVPITINGNTLVPGDAEETYALVSLDAARSNYITLQATEPLSEEEKEELERLHVAIQEYVSENTYLCRYEPADLEKIKVKDFVKHVAVYDQRFKTYASLKESLSSTTVTDSSQTAPTPLTVVVQLHDAADRNVEETKSDIAVKAEISNNEIAIEGNTIRVTLGPENLHHLEKLDSVKSINEAVPMALYNNVSREILQADVGLTMARYRGKSQVVAVADTGFDTGSREETHPAFTGRIKKLVAFGRKSTQKTDDPHGHGTRVSGSIIGNGYSDSMGGIIQGTAPEAELIVQSLLTDQNRIDTSNILELLTNARESGASIHSNSWGPDWSRIPGQKTYDPDATTIDQFVWDNKDFLVFFAAGNDAKRPDAGKSQIGSCGSAKNCITVGATVSSRPSVNYKYTPEQTTPNDSSAVADFSSRGPTTMGRIKPDIMAPGTAILSSRSRIAKGKEEYGVSLDGNWMFDSGTSMATPLAAGCAAALRGSLMQDGRNEVPSAALLKAMLINGAVDLKGLHGAEIIQPAPNNVQGFGRISLQASIIEPGLSGLGYQDGVTLRQGQVSNPVTVSVPKGVETGMTNELNSSRVASINAITLRVTLVYTDMPGQMLQSDLNLIVIAADGSERHGNMGTGAEFDTANNVERVVWENIPSGNVNIFVRCKRTTTPRLEQPYALVWKLTEMA